MQAVHADAMPGWLMGVTLASRKVMVAAALVATLTAALASLSEPSLDEALAVSYPAVELEW